MIKERHRISHISLYRGEEIGKAPVESGSLKGKSEKPLGHELGTEWEKGKTKTEAANKRKELMNSIELKNDTQNIYKEYQTLKGNAELKKLLEEADKAEALGEELSERKKEEILKHRNEIVKKLHLMSINLSKEAAKKLPNGFNREQMVDQAFNLIEDWGLTKAESDFARFFGAQEATYEIMKEQLGADFEKLSPAEQIRRTIKVANIKNISGEAKDYLNALGSDMPVGLAHSWIQRGGETIMKGTSLNKGSFFGKAIGAAAGILTVTSLLANVLGPLTSFSFSLMKNVRHPRKAVSEIREQIKGAWGNKKTIMKRVLGTSALAGGALLALNPKAFMKGAEGIVGAGGKGVDYAGKKVGEVKESITHTTPSHEIIKLFKEDVEKNRILFTGDSNKNADILMNFYKSSEDGFELDTLRDIRNIDHLQMLQSAELDTENMSKEMRIAYEMGRARLKTATEFIETANHLSDLGIRIPEKPNYGKLAELMLDKYNHSAGKKSFLSKAGGVASDVAGGAKDFGIDAAKYFDYLNIIGGRDKYKYSSDVREGEEIPPEILEGMKSIVPESEELEKIGLKPKEDLKKNEKAPVIFGLLINQVRRLQHPRSFIETYNNPSE